MNISGKFYLFVEDVKGKKKDFKTFSATISHKNEDGTYLNKKVVVYFNGELKDKTAKLDSSKCYEVEVSKGWLDVRKYTNKENKEIRELCLVINEAKVLSQKEIKKEKAVAEDLPF